MLLHVIQPIIQFYKYKFSFLLGSEKYEMYRKYTKLDRVGPVDNRPSTT